MEIRELEHYHGVLHALVSQQLNVILEFALHESLIYMHGTQIQFLQHQERHQEAL